MAISIEELVADIEKRMIALGYEDFEELYNQDHDDKSLKLLKRRLMDEAKLARENKKERTRLTKSLREVIVKLSKIYKKDLYIYNGIYVVPGKISEESLKGKFLVSIKTEYIEPIKSILFKKESNEVIFIRDISDFKTIIDDNIEDKDVILSRAKEAGIIDEFDEEKTNSFMDKLKDELESINTDRDEFIPLDIDISNNPDILSLKRIFHIKYKDFPDIEGNIQLFPFFTEKETPYIEFMSDEFNNNGNIKLYYARFHVDYTYFDIYFKIYYF